MYTPAKLFIQMSGVPGAGKTTIAHAIAPYINAVIIDHDITKSALLDADVPVALAGKASYHLLGAVAQHLLSQGHTVIFDSPCFYVDLLKRGQQITLEANATYLYIECVVHDLTELDRRLRERPRHRSQVAGVWAKPTAGSGKTKKGAKFFQDQIANMKRPETDYLVLDMTQPLELCVEKAIAYIKQANTTP